MNVPTNTYDVNTTPNLILYYLSKLESDVPINLYRFLLELEKLGSNKVETLEQRIINRYEDTIIIAEGSSIADTYTQVAQALQEATIQDSQQYILNIMKDEHRFVPGWQFYQETMINVGGTMKPGYLVVEVISVEPDNSVVYAHLTSVLELNQLPTHLLNPTEYQDIATMPDYYYDLTPYNHRRAVYFDAKSKQLYVPRGFLP
jgi:hypothetical protein